MVILRSRKKSIPPPSPQWMIIGNRRGGGVHFQRVLSEVPVSNLLGGGGHERPPGMENPGRGVQIKESSVGGGGGMDIFWKYIFQIPWKSIFRFCVQRSWETISNNFLVPRKSMETHLLNVFNFFKSYIFSWHWKP